MLQRTQLVTLVDAFNQRAASTPQQIAFQYFNSRSGQWHSTTWREIFKKSLEYRHAIASENPAQKSRVLIILENGIEWICLEQASLALGLVPVSVSPMDSLQSIRHVIQDTDPALIFVESDRLLQSLQLESNQHCIVLHKLFANSESVLFADWLENNKNFPSQVVTNINANDLATIVYTSGSSGKAKGVMLSHEAILNNAQACVKTLPITENDKLLCVTPLSHIMGRVADYYSCMLKGTTLVFTRALGMIDESIKKTHPTLMICTPYIIECAYSGVVSRYPLLVKYIEKHIDYTNGTGSWKIYFLFWYWLKNSLQKQVKNNFLYSLRALFVCGAPLSARTQRLAEILGLPIYEGYSLTEAGGVVAFNTPQSNHRGTAGRPLANTQVRIDQKQQFLISNNSLMLGYWGASGESKINSEGWLETGDIGSDDEGYLKLCSRRSSIIQLANGHFVHPEPVEDRIKDDSIFENVLLYGENQAKLTAICQIIPDKWLDFVNLYHLTLHKDKQSILADPKTIGILFTRINALLQTIPGAPRIDYILPAFDNWSEIGLINAQGKANRLLIEEYYAIQLKKIYQHQYPFNKSQ